MIEREELIEELTALAEDFDSLSDPARDDMMFIYEWTAPSWWTYYLERGASHYSDPLWKVITYPGLERAVVVAAVLREAIKRL